MDSFDSYVIRKLYQESAQLGDKLEEAEKKIDWERFRPIIQPMYSNDTPRGGRPNMDPVLMVKLLVLQAWYGLSDPELERQVNDRLSFRHFLGYPKSSPDYSTVWQFRERLAESGRDRLVWGELQRQLDAKGLKVRKGVVQDASFINADPGHVKTDKPRGTEAKTWSCRGSWTKKGGHSYFGYKLHKKMDLDHGLIRDLETPPASVHDGRIGPERWCTQTKNTSEWNPEATTPGRGPGLQRISECYEYVSLVQVIVEGRPDASRGLHHNAVFWRQPRGQIRYAFSVVGEGELFDYFTLRVHHGCPALPFAAVYTYVSHIIISPLASGCNHSSGLMDHTLSSSGSPSHVLGRLDHV